ncbi:MAG: hypothetical protein HYS71_02985 [Candidatus Omnitrophica bacterium]|nr:hypothetical protein [Candidatus Omnitrophota bacterium]
MRPSFRLRRFLARILHQMSLNLRALRALLDQRVEARSSDASAQLWDSLRPVGLPNIKVKVG